MYAGTYASFAIFNAPCTSPTVPVTLSSVPASFTMPVALSFLLDSTHRSHIRPQQAVRHYLGAGIIECNGGPGHVTFDMLSVMRRWVERGQAPREVPASRVEHGKVVRTRPLCPYPQTATYTGKGSTDEARNFVCK